MPEIFPLSPGAKRLVTHAVIGARRKYEDAKDARESAAANLARCESEAAAALEQLESARECARGLQVVVDESAEDRVWGVS